MSQLKLRYITSVYASGGPRVARSHTSSAEYVVSRLRHLADSSSRMELNLRRFLSEATVLQALNDSSQRIGSPLLPYHEVSHSVGRLLQHIEV